MRTTTILGTAGLVAFAGFLPSPVQARAESSRWLGDYNPEAQLCFSSRSLLGSTLNRSVFCAVQGTVVPLPIRLVSGLIASTARDWDGFASSLTQVSSDARESIQAFLSPLISAPDAWLASIRCGVSLPSCSSSFGLQWLGVRLAGDKPISGARIVASEKPASAPLPEPSGSAAVPSLSGGDPKLATAVTLESNPPFEPDQSTEPPVAASASSLLDHSSASSSQTEAFFDGTPIHKTNNEKSSSLATVEKERISSDSERLEQERIAAEQRQLEEERRIAAELKRQEKEAERARIAVVQDEEVAPQFPTSAATELERLAAERRALEQERNSLEKEKLAFERKQLEQERRALAAERRKIAKERRNLTSGAGNDVSQNDEISAVASVIQALETDDRQAEEQARLQAERQRLERERQRRIEAERRRLARQRRLEQEKQRLAIEQERLEQQRRQLAAEQSQLDQELVASQSVASGAVPEDVVAKVDSLQNPPLMLAGVPTVRSAFIDSEGNTPYLKQNPFQQSPVGTGDPLSDDVKRIMRVKQDLRRLDIALSTVKPQPTTYLARGNVKYSLGDFKGASKDYQRAIDADPQLADAYVNRGAALRKAGRLTDAIASYNKVIAMRPGDASAYRNRGIAREAQGDVQGAVADWRTASRLGDTEVLQWIAAATQPPTMAKTVGSVLAQVAPATPVVAKSNKVLLAEANGLLAKGSPSQARDLYIKILQNDASDRKALFNLAVAFRKAGQYKEALIAYDKYIAVVPNDPAAFRNRGIVKEMQRDLRGACTDWQSALQLGANDVQAWINQQCR